MDQRIDAGVRRTVWEEELAELKARERSLKQDNVRISNEARALRSRIYGLVEQLKRLNSEAAA